MSLTQDKYARTEARAPSDHSEHVEPLLKKQRRKLWFRWIVVLLILIAAGTAFQHFSAVTVDIVSPQTVLATETLNLAGVVEGKIESSIAADVQGTVTKLYVRENAAVKKGEVLARIQDSLARRTFEQANLALATARAEEARLMAGVQKTDIDGARARVTLAQAGVTQARAALARSQSLVIQGTASIRERQASVAQARATLEQANSRLSLVEKTRERVLLLSTQGALPRARYDEAESAYNVARAEVVSAKQLVNASNAALAATMSAQEALRQDVVTARQGVAASLAIVAEADSALRTLIGQPRIEDVALVKSRVREAAAAVITAQTALNQTVVRAPFDGTVTEIIAEEGSAITAAGVLKMIQSSHLQVRLDIDESNLPDLRVGQHAFVANPANPGQTVSATLTKIFGHVDPARGTVRVTVTPTEPVTWIRAGQTVDVNIVLRENVKRLTVPLSAVRKNGDQTVVFIAKDDHAVAIPVTTGLVAKDYVSVLSGLESGQRVVADAGAVQDGSRIRSKR